MRTLGQLISEIEEIGKGYIEPCDYIYTDAKIVEVSVDKEELTFNNRQLQGTLTFEATIYLLDSEVAISQDSMLLCYGDIKNYVEKSESHPIYNSDNVINFINEEMEISKEHYEEVIEAVKKEVE